MHKVILVFLFVAICFSCSKESEKRKRVIKSNLTKVTLQLNWFPEAEHGGYFTAALNGIYAKEKIEVKIVDGGPRVPVETIVALGRADFGIANADKLLTVHKRIPLVGLMSPYQQSPRCIIVHESSPVKDLSQLHLAKTLILNTTKPFYKYLCKKYPKIANVNTIPYNKALFLTKKGYAIQGYTNSEPLVFAKKNIKVRVLPLSDIGFNPYTSVLFTTKKMIKEKPRIVQAMVKASVKGWTTYLKNPILTNKEILRRHAEMRPIIAQSARVLKDLMLLKEAKTMFGIMKEKRWQTLSQQLLDCGAIKAKVDLKKVYTLEFLKK